MTGPEHYRIAESCLIRLGEQGPDEDSPTLLAEAAVHAQLAQVALTFAINAPSVRSHDEWHVAITGMRP